jgi:hypothetical protein
MVPKRGPNYCLLHIDSSYTLFRCIVQRYISNVWKVLVKEAFAALGDSSANSGVPCPDNAKCRSHLRLLPMSVPRSTGRQEIRPSHIVSCHLKFQL